MHVNVLLVAIFLAGFGCGFWARHYISVRRRERARTTFDYDNT